MQKKINSINTGDLALKEEVATKADTTYVDKKDKQLKYHINHCNALIERRIRLYHTDGRSKQLYRLNVETFAVEASRREFGGSVKGIGGGFDGHKGRLFHVDDKVKLIYELDPDTLEEIKHAPLPEKCLGQGIGGDFDGEKLRLFLVDSSNNNRKIHELDIETLQPKKTVILNHITKLYGIDGIYDGEDFRILATGVHNNQGYIFELNPDTLEEIKRTPSISNKPYGITGVYDGEKCRLFYCEYQNNKIYELDIKDFREIKSMQGPNTFSFGLGAIYDICPNSKLPCGNAKTTSGSFNMSFWQGTESDYANILNKDENTIYFIEG